jgi:hypothetical protein
MTPLPDLSEYIAASSSSSLVLENTRELLEEKMDTFVELMRIHYTSYFIAEERIFKVITFTSKINK